MRSILFLLALTIGALPQAALAQAPLLRAAAKHVPMPTFDLVNYKLQCPAGHIPTNYSHTPQYPYDINEDQYRLFTNAAGAVVDKSAVSSATQLDGGGYSLSVYNVEHHDKNLQALAFCISTAASADNAFQLVRVTGTVARATQGTVTAFCPADSPVAFAGFSNVDQVAIQDYGNAPVWGAPGSPILLSSFADGSSQGPPTGWQVRVYNVFSSNTEVAAYAVCGKAPGMRAYVYSTTAPPAAFGLPTPFSLYAPVPEGWTAVNIGYDGGNNAVYLSSDMWLSDGTVVGIMSWYPNISDYSSGGAQVRSFIVRGQGAGTGGRAVAAVLAMPGAAAPAPTIVPVVEFYHAALDHYFITANADEIAKLDNGTFQGWARTGESFNVYAPGSAGPMTRRPVCREYGNPIYGLDSHFYSASPDECVASLVTTGGAWILEASEVFQMDLPTTAGACPAGDVPVHRIWNKRRDSNHRYTTKTAIRDQMVARGGVAEGYGANAVALCALP